MVGPSPVEFRCVFRVRLTCFHRVCRTINARPRNNNGINHPSRSARCLGPRSISLPILFAVESNRIQRKSSLIYRVMEISCTGPPINLFIGRICKYPFRNTAKHNFLLPLPVNLAPTPSVFLTDLLRTFSSRKKRKKKRKKRVFTFIVVGDAFYEIHVGVVKRELRKLR